ncbi:MAG: hypothetical protein APF77_20655 [Clostridia bacterium BRH_c25]|nr:MAG: hypothetical protein APF77_20655 [Clostridia bacterium BRH_c25]
MRKLICIMLIGAMLVFMGGWTQTAKEETKKEKVPNKPEKTEVFLIGSIHYNHTTNPKYSMQFLLDYIRKINPDVIAIEVNEEDLEMSYEELNEEYPPDFPEVKKEFEAHKKIVGFNWKPQAQIDDRQSYLNTRKQMWMDLVASPLRKEEKAIVQTVMNTHTSVIANCSAYDVNSEAFDALTKLKQDLVVSIITGSEYDSYRDLGGGISEERKANIHNNIKQIIESNSGKKIVIVTGAGHRPHMVQFISETFPDVKFKAYFNES